jgi:hypothetical protein
MILALQELRDREERYSLQKQREEHLLLAAKIWRHQLGSNDRALTRKSALWSQQSLQC